ncbi:MAG TPA: STAS domain-containing protein, partial [Xanthomonadales bacterium]|nr:STAS domain-containing protein [Xanthomonadales bacterium]
MSDAVGCVIDDAVVYLKLRGELRHDNAAPLESLIEHCFEEGHCSIRGAVIDLNDVSFLDSTAIGLLAAIARALQARKLPPPSVFSTNPEINQLLRSLRLDQAFVLVEKATDGRQLSAAAQLA